MKFTVVLERGMDNQIVDYCPALKGCVSQGPTEEEALKNIKEAIELYIESEPKDIQLHNGKYKICELAL